MKRSAFETKRDQAVADAEGVPVGFTHEFMCRASGCPNRWAVDNGASRLCSAHATAEPKRWPEITQIEIWNETERARHRGEAEAWQAELDKAEVADGLRQLSTKLHGNGGDPKAWARVLKAREEAGEQLGRAQREAWRVALPERAPRLDKEPPP